MTAKLDIITRTHRSVIRPMFFSRSHKPPIARGHRTDLDLGALAIEARSDATPKSDAARRAKARVRKDNAQ